MSNPKNSIVPVILSGGSGARLWPLSREAMPKQFLALAGPGTMIQDTMGRARGEGFAPPIVITNQEHRFLVAEQLRTAGGGKIILEPAGRNTAPAAAVAALQVLQSDPEGLLLLMPSDHAVTDVKAFQQAVIVAAGAARTGALVTFGITPDRPETGYGYIKAGAPAGDGVVAVERFVEKPDLATARQYLADGGYSWNSGMFLFQAKAFLPEVERLQPAMLKQCRDALALAHRDADFIRLDSAAFLASPAHSIDRAIMERTRQAVMVPVDMGWSDVGSWQSLWNLAARDAQGNAIQGDVLAEASRNSYIRSEGPLVAAVGVEDLVIVATKDAVLVGRRDAAQDVSRIVEQLDQSGRGQHIHHAVVHRPWGTYESIASGPGFQVKRIMVNPGAKLSLQAHRQRAEHWIVVAGTAQVTCDDRRFALQVNEATFIPLGARHRLENTGAEPLHLIEVQSGAYLGEDDIMRFDDAYGRVPAQ